MLTLANSFGVRKAVAVAVAAAAAAAAAAAVADRDQPIMLIFYPLCYIVVLIKFTCYD